MKYSVYVHKFSKSTGELAEWRMIVVRDTYGIISHFTGLENFSRPYTGQPPKIQCRPKPELEYICKALNYIFTHNKIKRIADITSDMVFAFFDWYCNTPKKATTDSFLSQQSLNNCISHVSHFFANLSLSYPMSLSSEDLLRETFSKRNAYSNRITKKYEPAYIPTPLHSRGEQLLRDIPLDIVNRLIHFADIHDPMLSFAIVAGVSAGLRPSCVMNMRQEDSPVSAVPGISVSYLGQSISNVKIDLTREFILRSDNVNIGKIKRERTVVLYKPFIEEFMIAYKKHLLLLRNYTNIEEAYKPMFVTRSGKAMTYAAYRIRLHNLVRDYLVPDLMHSSHPEHVALAQLLSTQKISPHIFRHCFTVRLVSEGLGVEQVMYYRGDSSPESAIAYLSGKQELIQKLLSTHEQVITGLSSGGAYDYKI